MCVCEHIIKLSHALMFDIKHMFLKGNEYC